MSWKPVRERGPTIHHVHTSIEAQPTMPGVPGEPLAQPHWDLPRREDGRTRPRQPFGDRKLSSPLERALRALGARGLGHSLAVEHEGLGKLRVGALACRRRVNVREGSMSGCG